MISGKIAAKKLTESDLTFFRWHFGQNPSKQKAINLNADVFIKQLYPSLPATPQGKTGRMPVDLFVYGPGLKGEQNLQRKIVKPPGGKNWRLNGELVDDDEPARYSPLTPGDFVVIEFIGELLPKTARAIFIAGSVLEDTGLHSELEKLLGSAKMMLLTSAELSKVIQTAHPPDGHPIHELGLDADPALEDAALGGNWGTQKLLKRKSGRKLSKEQLQRAKELADDIGRRGEECVNYYLSLLKTAGGISDYKWVSAENAIAPYDFEIILPDSAKILADAKSTTGPFNNAIHLSLAELRTMSESPHRYDIYRVVLVGEQTAYLRIAEDTREFARSVIKAFEDFPAGVTADNVSVSLASPLQKLSFSAPVTIEVSEEPEDE